MLVTFFYYNFYYNFYYIFYYNFFPCESGPRSRYHNESLISNFTKILFALPPSSVQILNERNEIFTIEDDPYMGLSVLSCVRGEEGENKKAAVLQVKAIVSHQESNLEIIHKIIFKSSMYLTMLVIRLRKTKPMST